MLYVNDIFYSIQGESSYAGYPCKFIRLAGCNLKCSYCDTLESLDIKNSKRLEIDEIIKLAENLGNKKVKLAEITGGEPMIQDDTILLLDTLVKLNYTVLLETNGTVSLEKVNDKVRKIIDVKCPSSGFAEKFNFENLKYIYKNDEIKFVLSSNEDYEYAKNFIKKYFLNDFKLIFSVVKDVASPKEIAEKMLKDGLNVRLGIQLHKILQLK